MSTPTTSCRLGKKQDNNIAVKTLGKEAEQGESVCDVYGACGHLAAAKSQTTDGGA